MAYEFLLPDIGEGVVEAEILKWFVKPGDAVVEDQPLVEVMTDKATVTIPSPKRGTVTRLLWKEGDVARVHHALVEMELEGGAPEVAAVVPLPKAGPSASSPAPASPASEVRAAIAEAVERASPPPAGRALATPAVRALAREMGVDIQRVQPTGPGGRVTKDDVRGRAGSNGQARGAGPGVPQPTGSVDPGLWRSSRSAGCAGASPRRWRSRNVPRPISPSSSSSTRPSSSFSRTGWREAPPRRGSRSPSFPSSSRRPSRHSGSSRS